LELQSENYLNDAAVSSLIMKKDKGPKIVAGVIIDLMGSPKDHVDKLLKDYVDKIEKEEDYITLNEKHLEPAKEKEDQPGLFSAFAEIEIELYGPENLLGFCMDYMPSSIEIFEPDEFRFDSRDFTGFVNDLQAKLHRIEMISKKLMVENKLLNRNAMTITNNIIRLALVNNPRTEEEIEKMVGIPAKQLSGFLKSLVEKGKIEKKQEKYYLKK
jgi:hypothetical protein